MKNISKVIELNDNEILEVIAEGQTKIDSIIIAKIIAYVLSH